MGETMGWIIGAIGLMGGFLAWYQKITIAAALGEFKDSLREEFGKRFLDATLAAAKLDPMTREIGELRAKIVQVEDYAHTRYHDLSSEVQKCLLQIERREK